MSSMQLRNRLFQENGREIEYFENALAKLVNLAVTVT